MSRTEKTQPYWVKRFDHYREIHNHINGECNLPESPRAQGDSWKQDWRVDCYYEADWSHPIYRCSCPMCGYDAFSVPRRVRERREGKRQAREWWREY